MLHRDEFLLTDCFAGSDLKLIESRSWLWTESKLMTDWQSDCSDTAWQLLYAGPVTMGSAIFRHCSRKVKFETTVKSTDWMVGTTDSTRCTLHIPTKRLAVPRSVAMRAWNRWNTLSAQLRFHFAVKRWEQKLTIIPVLIFHSVTQRRLSMMEWYCFATPNTHRWPNVQPVQGTIYKPCSHRINS